MALTNFVAWWGALLSTVVFGWDVYKYVHAGPRLRLSVQSGMVGMNMPLYEGKTLILASVNNRGDRPTTITNLCCEYLEKRRFHRKNRSGASIVGFPSLAQQLPFELKPSGTWSGIAIQDAETERRATEGEMYMLLFHSHSEKPVRQRVIIGTKRK